MTQKIYLLNKKNCCHYYKKDIEFKVALQYLFNVVIIFKTVFYLKLILKLKLDSKTFNFENLEKISQKILATIF